jgi:hypothetical protein
MKRLYWRSVAVMLATGVTVALAVMTPAQAATQKTAAAKSVVRFFSDKPLSASAATPLSSLPASARAQISGTASASSSTPSGYKLRGGRENGDSIYNSAYVWAIEARCGTTCTPVQQVKLSLKENIYGGNSKRWLLTLGATPWSGSPRFNFHQSYQCGVNIYRKDDQTCSTWKTDGADAGFSSGAKNGFQINRSFGNTANVKKFPMVNFQIEFADGSWAIGDDGHRGEKFRGWDVCVKARSTKLCGTTGEG